MKKLLIFLAVTFVTIASIVVVKVKVLTAADFECSNVEAFASCEIADDKGRVKYSCTGDTGTCIISGFGHTLTCSGTKVEH